MTGLAVITRPEAPALTRSWLAGQLSPHTARAYGGDIEQFLSFIGHEDLADIERGDILDYRGWLVANYRPATVNRRLSAVRQLFAEAKVRGVITEDPTARLKGHRSEGDYRTTNCPSEEEVHALLDSITGDAWPDLRDKAMLYTMATLGLRREEVTRLRVEDIVQYAGTCCMEITGKGSKRRREPVPACTLTAVRSWIDTGQFASSDPIFPSLSRSPGGSWAVGNALSGNGVWCIVQQRMNTAGLGGRFSPHSLRHYAITELRNKGMAIDRIQRLAGHANIRTTLGYIHPADDLQDGADKYVDL